jgi:hypothetical protein
VPIAQLLQAGRRRPLRQPEFLKLMQLLTQQRVISNGMAQLQFEEVWPTYSQAKADDALLGAACSPKLVEFRRLIRDLVIDQERKVVVFSQWRRMLRLAEWAVRDMLEEHGLRSAFFTGQESQRLRTQNVVDFHDDQSVRVLFLSDAGGVGLNLQRAANACINLELPWNPAVLEQRIGRIYRLGQESPIDVINLITEYGIEARIAGLVGNKKAVFSGLFDGTTDAVRFEAPASFLTDIERLVEPVQVPAPAGDGEGNELLDDSDDAADERSREPASGDGGLPSEGPVEPGPEASAEDTALADDETATSPSEATESIPVPMAAGPSFRAASIGVTPLFERISVTRTENGGLRLEAPPEAAEELSQLLQGLAQLLQSAAARKSPG